MNTQDITQKVLQIMKQELGWEEPLQGTSLAENLDSVQKLSLVVAIEDHYEICFDPEDGEEIESLDQIVALIQRKTQEEPISCQP